MNVKDCCKCVHNKPFERRRRLLHLFPASNPVEFVAMDILGPLLKTSNDNPFMLVIMNRYL